MRLDEAIVAHFDETARAALAAGLGIDEAALPNATLPNATLPNTGEPAARAASLVEAAARAGRAADLLAALAAARPAVPWAELPYPALTLARLHAALCRRHSLDSLRTLCFRLGLDFDDLPGESKAGRARELILALERQGRVAELLSGRATHPYATGDRQRPRRGGRVGRVFRLGLAAGRVLRSSLASARSRVAPPVARLLASRAVSPAAVVRLSHGVSLLAAAGLWLLAAGVWNDPSDPRGSSPATAVEATPTDPARPTTLLPLSPAPLLPLSPAPLLPLSPSPPPPHPTTTPSPALVIIGERGANLRRGPGLGYPVVMTLRAGARLELRAVSPTGEWYQVRLPGHGLPWIDAGFAAIAGGTGGVPVAAGDASETWRAAENEAAAGPQTAQDGAPSAWAGASPTPAAPTVASVPTVQTVPTARPTALPTQTPPRPTLAPTLPPP